ncbi:hypothetical protein LCGC14_1366340, partial [marine sediment metagenome]
MLSGWYCLIPHELDPDRFGIFRKFYEKDFLSISKYNGKAFSFCNTENKSYDLMVQACLILYKHYFPSVEIDSDGNEKYWLEAKFFVHKITGIETLPEHFKLEQKINDFITLKLENAKTNIYVNEERFNQCKFLLL